MKDSFDFVVLGGGAAGLMCAIEAGKRGRRVAVLERAERIGKKILISGGGRCNFTNLHCSPEDFISNNPHFAKSALARYTARDFIALVRKYGIPYHEKTLGQLFCDHSAREIVNMLSEECRSVDVQIITGIKVDHVEKVGSFSIYAGERTFCCDALVVATGGLSIPQMGATSFGYDIARQFGLKIIPTRPALVPLVLNTGDRARYCDLTGVSADIIAAMGKQQFREKMLITHRGLSGPAILQISSYWQPGERVRIDLDPDEKFGSAATPLQTHRDIASLKTAVRSVLVQRLADRWVELHQPQSLTNNALSEFERQLHSWQVLPEGTEGYGKAEVTAGGVDTNELSAKTMESRKVPGLFFIGEVVDVTGHLGGFNFQWAWASGFCAGQAL